MRIVPQVHTRLALLRDYESYFFSKKGSFVGTIR